MLWIVRLSLLLLFGMSGWELFLSAEGCSITLNDNVCPLNVAENAPAATLPTVCSSRGSCIRGACACNVGWADVDCSKVHRRLIMGTMAITQAAFDEAPTRYSDFFVRTFENLKAKNLELPPFEQISCFNYIIKTPLIVNSGILMTLNYSSIKITIVDAGLSVSASLGVSIPSIPVDAYVSTTPGSASCCTPANVSLYAETASCTEACTSSLGEGASVKFSAFIQATILPFINSTTGRVQAHVVPGSLTVTLSPADLSFKLSCGLTSYPQLLFNLYNGYVQPWGVLLANELQSAVKEEIDRAAEDISFGTAASVNTTNTTQVELFAKELDFIGNSHMMVSLEGFIRKNRFGLDPSCAPVWTTYADSDEDALLPVPNSFGDFDERAVTDNILLRTLVEARASRVSLRGTMWAALLDEPELIASFTRYTRSISLLDAQFDSLLTWQIPTFEFPIASAANGSQPVRNTIRFTVQGGDGDITCNNTGVSQLSAVFAAVSFDLHPIAVGNFTSSSNPKEAIFSLTGDLVAWDISRFNMNLTEPQKLSVPNALVKILADEFMKNKIPIANQLLHERALAIPSNLVRFVPGPRLEARHDYENQGKDGGNGYLVASTRCACVTTTPAEPYAFVETRDFQMEIIPRCTYPCPSSTTGRLLLSDPDSSMKTKVIKTEPKTSSSSFMREDEFLLMVLMAAQQQDYGAAAWNREQRSLASSSSDLLMPYGLSGSCGALPFSQEKLKSHLTTLLQCATQKESNSFITGGQTIAARFGCMGRTSNTSTCSSSSELIQQYSNCRVPMSIAIPALFNGKECIEGKSFSCNDSLRDILLVNCRCSKAGWSDVLILAECNETFVPALLVGIGILLPIILYILLLVSIKCCRCDDGETWMDVKAALSFRVERRSRDVLLINLALLAACIFLMAVVGWVIQDPFKIFAKSVVSSDLFQLSPEIETDFEPFMVSWSSVVLFFMSLETSQFFILAITSYILGRCIWLHPLPTYVRNDTWVEPPVRVVAMWRRMQFVTINLIRVQALAIICALSVPPLFFSFRFSVKQVKPQFAEAYMDTSFDLAANLTSFATSVEYVEALVSVVGFALMSSAIGFISSGLIYVFHGAAPGCFAAAQVMIFLMDRKENRDRAEYDQYKSVLPPPDNSELDRWRRIVFLFVWCSHAAGALGSFIAAILLYQVIRATSSWAVFWLITWVLPLPIIYLSTSKKYRSRHRLLGILYVLDFVVFTTVMNFLSPDSTGFTNWLAVLLVVSIFFTVFLILLSEFLNVADKIEAGQLIREKGDQVLVNKPLMRGEESDKNSKNRMKSLVFGQHHRLHAQVSIQQPAADADDGVMVGRNPLFEHEREKMTGIIRPGVSPTRTQAQGGAGNNNNLSDHELMKMMTTPTESAPIRQEHVSTMAEAAENLRRRVNRMSVVHGLDEEEMIATFKKADEQKAALQASTKTRANAVLTMTQERERERMRRRISKRLAARGVAGNAASELADRIADYHAMKMAVEQQKWRLERSKPGGKSTPLPAPPPVPLHARSPPPLPALPEAGLYKAVSPLSPLPESGYNRTVPPLSPLLETTSSKSPLVGSGNVKPVSPLAAGDSRNQPMGPPPPIPPLPAAFTPTSSPAGMSKEDFELMRAAAKTSAFSSSASPPQTQRNPFPAGGMVQSPLMLSSNASSSSLMSGTTGGRDNDGNKVKSPSHAEKKMLGGGDMSSPEQSSRPLARVQAAGRTGNITMDDLFNAQFNPDWDPRVARGFDGDDSFLGFVREVATQLWTMARSYFTSAKDAWNEQKEKKRIQLEQEKSERELAKTRRQVRRPKTRAAETHHKKFINVANQGKGGGSRFYYSANRIRSKISRIFSENVRPMFAAIVDVVQERKERDDPATYGLRVPGRRLIFIQGLLLMLILLIHVGLNRTSVNKLKDDAIKLILSASPVEVDAETAYNWPGVENITEALDVPLAAYVKQATDAYALTWVIFTLWGISLVVEIVYASFGRDMEEKRKGIKLARNIGFINLPLLLLAVVLPCAPDYVGLSLGGIKNVVPECAPKLTSTIIGVASNLFGVLAGTYLAFQTMVVLLLIVPSVSRALFFVITREILDMHKLRVFEPRKAYLVTKKRLQNARFVWRIFPFMSPVLTYLPLLLVCQLLGKLYVSFLVFFFMATPILSAQFSLHSRAEDQKVSDWLIYSTLWIMLYASTMSIIILVESLNRNQFSFVLRMTFQSWPWYLKIASEVCLAIVVTSDVLYQFMASDSELEADTVINDYLEALEDQAQHMEFMQQYQSEGADQPSTTRARRLPSV